MEMQSDQAILQVLIEKLNASLRGPIPGGTDRDFAGTVLFPNKATAVIGMRRAGKTTFLHQIRRQRVAAGIVQERLPYVNLEDERLAGLEARHLGLLLEEYYRRQPGLRNAEVVTWCFDEIQLVPGWERFVRRLLDTEKADLLISGSSAALLSREVATSMRGRGWEVVIHPFCFREALRHAGYPLPADAGLVTAAERSRIEHALLGYLETGGFPEAQIVTAADRYELLTRYVDVAILRDVIERHRVTNVTALGWLVRHLLGNPGGLFSVEKFHRQLKSQGIAVGRDTVHALVGHLEDCFLVRTTWVEAGSERRRMVNPRKIHPVDQGFIPIYDRTGRANRGHALETAVRVELERRRMRVSYVRTRDGYEVDFLARPADGGPALIQVAAEIGDRETLQREVRALLAAREELPDASLHLVTLTPELVSGAPDQITVHPAWRWLLGLNA